MYVHMCIYVIQAHVNMLLFLTAMISIRLNMASMAPLGTNDFMSSILPLVPRL